MFMKLLLHFICAIFTMLSVLTQASDVISPTLITNEQIEGDIFNDFSPVVEEHESDTGPYTTQDVEFFLSSDKHFDAGIYKSGANRFRIDESYGVDEYMHFLTGGVTLTSSDGSILRVNTGDSVVIPKEWTGVWETEGYTKIYIIYSADSVIE
jgi:uncharacterized cupin superfamily protein